MNVATAGWSGAQGRSLVSYEVIDRLAVGGMAELYLARASAFAGFENYVVVKRLRPEHAGDAGLAAAFMDEARLAVHLRHDNIARVYDVGEIDGECFFTMEYLHGQDLETLLDAVARAEARVPVEHAVHIAARVADALAYVHELVAPGGGELRLVHRDVSPANIMVTFDGAVKLIDFGVAKTAVASEATVTGFIKGKPPYMSPEQCTREPLDGRSDVFSLGIVLYELATLNPLFRRADAGDQSVMKAIVAGDYPAPRDVSPELPRALDEIITRALAPDRDQRFTSARELQRALERFAESEGLSMTRTGLGDYIGALFGRPAEPWLMVPEDATVISPALDIALPLRPDDVTRRETPTAVASRLTSALNDTVAQTAMTAPYGDTERALPGRERAALLLAEAPTQMLPYDAPTVVQRVEVFDGPPAERGADDDPDTERVCRVGTAAALTVVFAVAVTLGLAAALWMLEAWLL